MTRSPSSAKAFASSSTPVKAAMSFHIAFPYRTPISRPAGFVLSAWPSLNHKQLLAKRALDLAVAIPLLLLGSPVFVLIAILIWLTSPGPILFRQVRIGH